MCKRRSLVLGIQIGDHSIQKAALPAVKLEEDVSFDITMVKDEYKDENSAAIDSKFASFFNE